MEELSVRRFYSVLGVVASLAAALRAVIGSSRGWIGYDEANYLMIARNADAGLGYVQSAHATYVPKFHLLSFLAPQALTRVLGDEFLSSKVLFVVLGTLAVALVGLLARSLFGPRVGLIAASMAAAAPVLTSLLVASISHTLFLPAFLLGTWLAWQASTSGRTRLAFFSGVLIGVAWWARADGLLIAPTLALYLLVGGALLGGRRRAVRQSVGFLAGFAALYSLYGLFVRAISDSAAQAHGPLFDFLVYPPTCETSRELASYDSLLKLAIAEPDCILQKVVENAQAAPQVLLTWTGFPFVLLPLLGAAWMAKSRFDKETLSAHLLLLLSTLPIAFYLPFHYAETRYVAPYAAIAFVWCALGLEAIGERLGAVLPRVGSWAVTVSVLGFLFAVTVLHVPRMETIGGAEYVEAGRWINRNAGPDAVVWTSQSQVAFFAERAWSYPPPFAEISGQHLSSNAEILVVLDERDFYERNPTWSQVITQTAALEPRYTTRGSPPRATVFRLQPDSLRPEPGYGSESIPEHDTDR